MRKAASVKRALSFYEYKLQPLLQGRYDLGGRGGCASRKSEDLSIRATCRHVEARHFQHYYDYVMRNRLKVRAQFHTVKSIRSRRKHAVVSK